jgi:exodeoxyribonuclease-3
MPTKLLSWNVNGLRAVLGKGFREFLASHDPDVLCLQETKVSDDLTEAFIFPDYPHVYWNCAEKKGYAGTAILSKKEPSSVRYGLGKAKHDREGRVITAEFGSYFLVNVYTPNSQNHDENGRPRRLDYRTLEWDTEFRRHLQRLEKTKPVVVCGDLNVAHREIDLANPRSNRRNAGFTDEERAGFDKLVEAGFVDTFRHLNPDARARYSWWSYRAGARKRNVGWRIDYFCVSESLIPKVRDALILDGVHGSDHCPVGLVLQ